MDELKNHSAAHLKNAKKWIYKDYTRNGMVIKNVVKTKCCKHRIVIYHTNMKLMLDKNS